MNEREQKALDAILNSKNYRDICPDTVKRVFEGKLPLYKSLKEADKAARTALHGITGAFMTAEEISAASKMAKEFAEGNADALEKTLDLHSSTRERKNSWRVMYQQVFAAIGGTPESVLDLACGLNPIALGSLGVKTVRGYDIQGGAINAVNAWAEAAGWDVRAFCADLLCDIAFEPADLALMMKLLPLLDRQKAGSAVALLESCPAKHILVTFPTRTLGGRNVGMEEQYTTWMDANTPESLETAARFVVDTELCYLLKRRDA